jgi:hypothetical protein
MPKSRLSSGRVLEIVFSGKDIQKEYERLDDEAN